jgi:hypothetical protein
MRVPLLTPQDEILAARIKKGDSEARAWMFKANLRLVVKIAHDYANLGLPLLDLISQDDPASSPFNRQTLQTATSLAANERGVRS